MLKTKACIGNERIRHAQAVPRSLHTSTKQCKKLIASKKKLPSNEANMTTVKE